MRVKFQYVACADVSVMAQQMQNEKGRFTFRQWNPKMIDTPWREDNDNEDELTCPPACFCCAVVERLVLDAKEEVINRVDTHAGCGPKEMMNEY
jgi:hypothetical protein